MWDCYKSFKSSPSQQKAENKIRPLAQQLPFQNQSWGCFSQQKGKQWAVDHRSMTQVVYPQQREDRQGHLGVGVVPFLPPWTLTHALMGR